jgi:alkylation response protein AidB-like acyl-CoA dehydrogenase
MLIDRATGLGPLERYYRAASAPAQGFGARLQELSPALSEGAEERDREARLPWENVRLLAAEGYPSLTVPETAGGGGIGLFDLCLLQEILAMADGPTALGLGWHLSLVLNVRTSGAWPDSVRDEVYRRVVSEGALVNSCASERETGSPSRGGRPTTRAEAVGDGSYRLTGRKTFATFSPALAWYLVSASMDDDAIGNFLVEAGTPGVRIDRTWDTFGMRASESQDLVLDGAVVGPGALVGRVVPGERPQRGADGASPTLHVPACYLGIALAARRDVLAFAWSHRPNSLPGPIAELPQVQDQIGRIELTLLRANALVFDAAAAWDAADAAERGELRGLMGAAKVAGTEAAVEAVDLAMRVVGGHSLARALPFERYYRDVRAGLHNPPMGDVALRSLGRSALASAHPPVS